MSRFLKYKGYLGTIEYSEEDNLLCGEVAGIKDLILYHGNNMDFLKKDFEEAIDHYLETCVLEGLEPNKTSKEELQRMLARNIEEALAV